MEAEANGPSFSAASRHDAPARLARGVLNGRLEGVLRRLSEEGGAPAAMVRQGHLALLKRWYYRPEARRPGEIFFADAEGGWPWKAMIRGVGRVAAKSIAARAAAE